MALIGFETPCPCSETLVFTPLEGGLEGVVSDKEYFLLIGCQFPLSKRSQIDLSRWQRGMFPGDKIFTKYHSGLRLGAESREFCQGCYVDQTSSSSPSKYYLIYLLSTLRTYLWLLPMWLIPKTRPRNRVPERSPETSLLHPQFFLLSHPALNTREKYP